RRKLWPSRATMTCADDVADTGGLPLNRSKPNSVRASKWITATSACQVKFRCEQPRPARAGHSCENIVAHSSKLSGQVTRSVTGCPPYPHRRAVDNNSRLTCSPRRASLGDNRDGVDLDEIVGRRHLADLDHRRGRRRRTKIFAPHFVDLLEMLHVADVDVDPADVVHVAAGLLDRGLQILAHL